MLVSCPTTDVLVARFPVIETSLTICVVAPFRSTLSYARVTLGFDFLSIALVAILGNELPAFAARAQDIYAVRAPVFASIDMPAVCLNRPRGADLQ